MEQVLTLDEIENEMALAGPSPRDHGNLEMIVRRPQVDQREMLSLAELTLEDGLVGDNWRQRGSSSTPDGLANPEQQITLMNSRVIQALTQDRAAWPQAGDQLFVDLDLSEENLPVGQRLAIGEAVVEISAKPHTGCAKFSSRFGSDAVRFVNSRDGRQNRRRGVNARVVQAGMVRVGDAVQKV